MILQIHESETKTQKLTIDNYLQNGWEINGANQFFKKDDIVTLIISVREGTANQILKLPEGYRPEFAFMVQAGEIGGNNAYAQFFSTGEVLVPNELIGKSIMINCSFYV